MLLGRLYIHLISLPPSMSRQTHFQGMIKLVRNVESSLPFGRQSILNVTLFVKHGSKLDISISEIFISLLQFSFGDIQFILTPLQVSLDPVDFKLQSKPIARVLVAKLTALVLKVVQLSLNLREVAVTKIYSFMSSIKLKLKTSRLILSLSDLRSSLS